MSRPATARLKVNPQVGAKPVLRWLRLDEMAVDIAYQRALVVDQSQALVRKIAMYWDWSLCQPLAVAKRPNGALMIVDGQHRHAAAKMRGDIESLPCVVTAYTSIGDEAAAFVALNQQRKPLSKLDLFKAALAAEDQAATEVMQTLTDCGFSLAAHSNYTAWKPAQLSNIGGIQAVWGHHGRRVVEPALRALALAFEGHVLRYAGTIFPGIAAFLVERPNAREGMDFVRLVSVLKGKSQVGWRKAIQVRISETGSRRDRACREVIAETFDGLVDDVPSLPLAASTPTPPPIVKKTRSFEEQLEAVRNGARLVEMPAIRRPDPSQTLGGVTGEINL